MKKKLFFTFIITVLYSSHALAQDSVKTHYAYHLDLPFIDVPFLKDAATMRANKTGIGKPTPKDYFSGYESPSMQQALAFTKNLHATNYYLNNLAWEKMLPLKKNKVWNRLTANTSSALVDLLFTYELVVFSPQWLHEEFHRNGLTQRGIASYDETYNFFTKEIANGSISRVSDEDMIRFKKEDPQGMVRSFAAGIESEFLLMRGLQKDNFFRDAKYPNVLLNILLTKHAVDYVNQFKRADFNNSIDSMNHYGVKIKDRDFVGWDFTAWVYDLHRPHEPYEARGVHPSGIGIDRAIKSTKLTQEEYSYLKKMGKMQYLNFISPFMLGINHIRWNENLDFNFAVRHYLNSFGYDLSADLMFSYKKKHFLMALHAYRNKYQLLPGVEMYMPSFRLGAQHSKFTFEPIFMLWLQPKEQLFHAKEATLGGFVGLRSNMDMGKHFKVYMETDFKSRGWVAGNPYLKANTSFRFGLTFNTGS